jgi:lipoate-protein ligase A
LTRWRWILEDPDPRALGERSGPWNMGVDEALLASAERTGEGAIRFYGWAGPWLSLGYGQRFDPDRARACAAAGVGVVRRSTGGRAVLHGCDLTYAVAAPSGALPAGLRPTYERIGQALVAGLCALDVPATREATGAGAGRGEFDCFAEPARDELVLAGGKLAGSAQRRTAGAFLQHGSIRLAPDPPEAVRACGLEGPGATSLSEHGVAPRPDALARSLARAFERVLGVELVPAPLTGAERATASARGIEPPPRSGPDQASESGGTSLAEHV